ncbi:MAG TPA: mechanosensitive ion channel family protein [Candidatus Polarisedimenticolia bacterium]|nr:mechanosensitive ion channel family protein [Candidatus Polarisedimenticolia bacterium]
MTTFLNDDLQRWLIALAVLAGSYLAGWFVRAVVLRRLASAFSRTSSRLDDVALSAFRPHIPIWLLLGGVAVAARIAPLAERAIDVADRLASAGFVLSISLGFARVATALLAGSAGRAGVPAGATTLMENLARTVVLALGGLLVLSNLGISITPLLTALGVGSLAVALALQPTLSNLFAGLHITIAKPIRVGDFVKLENGGEGFIVDIGWRATRVRELPNNIIIVPNARIADMVLTNYDMPEPEQAALVQVGVAYGSDLEHVERVTVDVARQVLQEVAGSQPSFDPFIRYHTFGDSSINFSVILRVRTFVDRYLVIHEFIKRIKRRYDQEGIEIPFPQRVLHAGRHAGGPLT